MMRSRDKSLPLLLLIAFAMGLAMPMLKAQPQPNKRGISASTTGRVIAELKNVNTYGELNTRYCAATANLLTRQDRYTMASFEANALGEPGALWWEWPADQFGRWLSVLHVADGTGWTTAQRSRADVLNVVLPLQRARGHFGTDPAKDTDNRVPSGNAFGLRGLLDAYEDTGDERALQAARKMVRFFEQNFDHYGKGTYIDEYYAHCLDGLVKLYSVDRTSQVLDLAQRIADRMGIHKHTHHALSAYRGMIELYDLTGNETYLVRTREYLDYIGQSRIVSGGIPELLPFTGADPGSQDEGCALADYVIVNLMMFARTGEDHFLETADNTLINHFFMNQFHTGGFGHRRYRRDAIGDKVFQGWDGQFGSENPGCCSMWGQWALGQVCQYAITQSGDNLEVNLYADVEVTMPEEGITLNISGDFPRQRESKITLYSKQPREFAIRLRVPDWADDAHVRVNGKAAGSERQGTRITLSRIWASGDEIDVRFASSMRLVAGSGTSSDSVAVYDGPQCLGIVCDGLAADEEFAVAVDKAGDLVLGDDGQPVVFAKGKPVDVRFMPIGDEWLHPDARNPNRIKVLFPIHTTE